MDTPKRLKIVAVRSASDKIMMVEEAEYSINDGNWNPGAGITDPGAKDIVSVRHDHNAIMPDPRAQVIQGSPNAQRRSNVIFFDGHGDYVSRLFAHDQPHYDPTY